MGVFCDFGFRGRDLQSPRHTKVYDPLPVPYREAPSLARPLEIEDDVFADPADLDDPGALQYLSDLVCGRLEGLRFFTKPNGFNGVARNPLMQAARDGFHLG